MPSYFAGLMSGTSLDGVDAVLVGFQENNLPKLVAKASLAMPENLKQLLHFLAHAETLSYSQLAAAEDGITRLYAQATKKLLANIEPQHLPIALGCHGQTLQHLPESQPSYSLQVFNPSLLAELSGHNVIADFRRRDLAAGGQGAPLVPAFHAQAFSHASKTRIIVNLGGIANITYLPNKKEQAKGAAVLGFDTGPANVLLDFWHEKNWRTSIDLAGQTAASGQVIESLVKLALADAYFARPAPKSTGREKFNAKWLLKLLAQLAQAETPEFKPEDVLCSLVEISALSLVQEIQRLDPNNQAEIYLAGGGWQNKFLVSRISALAAPRFLASTQELGLDPQLVEATAFAWLAWRNYRKETGNLPEVTGAAGARILGGFYPA